MSDFFDPPPPLEPEVQAEWDGPPHSVVPATLAIERIAARSDTAVVYLAAIATYPTGFAFDVCVLADDTDAKLDPFGWEAREISRHRGEIAPALLRLGFAFADGSKATNTGAYFNPGEDLGACPDAPVMAGIGGRGDRGTWLQHFWVWPLPPAGKLEYVCEWPDAGIPLTRTELDGDSILEAAGRVP